MKIIFGLAICLMLMWTSSVCAENADGDIKAPPRLVISAINAGYADGDIKQNYDFIEIYNTVGEPVELDTVRIEYVNSVGNIGGEIAFGAGTILNVEYLVLGFAKSPQYTGFDERNLYKFGSSTAGLASTAGALRLYDGANLLDEVCWGSAKCGDNYTKFGTTVETNTSLRRCVVDGLVEKCGDGQNFEAAKYYPEIDATALYFDEVELPPPQCVGLVFSEVYSYFETDYAEQFVEIYNPTEDVVVLEGCGIKYKNRLYGLLGELHPGEYYAYQNAELNLTKNPSTSNEISLVDVDGSVAANVIYYYGQKRGTAFAEFEDGWKQTYAPTMGVENVWREFRSCLAGKIINPKTGNCINFYEPEEPFPCPVGKYRNPETNRCRSYESIDDILKPCGDGYYRSPDTNRCRKISENTTELKPCADGYERNQETNRCRKIRVNNGADYGVDGGEMVSSAGWVGYGAMAVVVIAGVGYVGWQFRDEIKRGMMKLVKRERKP